MLLVDSGGVGMGHPGKTRLLRPLEQVPAVLVQPPLILLDWQEIVGPRSTIPCAISFWQPMASLVTTHPLSSSNSSSWGMAVISFDFSSVFTCPKVRVFAEAQPLTVFPACVGNGMSQG